MQERSVFGMDRPKVLTIEILKQTASDLYALRMWGADYQLALLAGDRTKINCVYDERTVCVVPVTGYM